MANGNYSEGSCSYMVYACALKGPPRQDFGAA